MPMHAPRLRIQLSGDTGDEWEIAGVRAALKEQSALSVRSITQGNTFDVRYDLSERQVAILLAGGLLNYIRNKRQTHG